MLTTPIQTSIYNEKKIIMKTKTIAMLLINYLLIIFFSSYIYSLNAKKNPFKCIIKISNKQNTAILNTGAKVSIIQKDNVLPEHPIHNVSQALAIESASGDGIKVLGKVYNLPLTINNKNIF